MTIDQQVQMAGLSNVTEEVPLPIYMPGAEILHPVVFNYDTDEGLMDFSPTSPVNIAAGILAGVTDDAAPKGFATGPVLKIQSPILTRLISQREEILNQMHPKSESSESSVTPAPVETVTSPVPLKIKAAIKELILPED